VLEPKKDATVTLKLEGCVKDTAVQKLAILRDAQSKQRGQEGWVKGTEGE